MFRRSKRLLKLKFTEDLSDFPLGHLFHLSEWGYWSPNPVLLSDITGPDPDSRVFKHGRKQSNERKMTKLDISLSAFVGTFSRGNLLSSRWPWSGNLFSLWCLKFVGDRQSVIVMILVRAIHSWLNWENFASFVYLRFQVNNRTGGSTWSVCRAIFNLMEITRRSGRHKHTLSISEPDWAKSLHKPGRRMIDLIPYPLCSLKW